MAENQPAENRREAKNAVNCPSTKLLALGVTNYLPILLCREIWQLETQTPFAGMILFPILILETQMSIRDIFQYIDATRSSTALRESYNVFPIIEGTHVISLALSVGLPRRVLSTNSRYSGRRRTCSAESEASCATCVRSRTYLRGG